MIRHHIIATRYNTTTDKLATEAQNWACQHEKRKSTVVVEFHNTDILFDYFMYLGFHEKTMQNDH